MHYNTFPPIKADPVEFQQKAEKLGIVVTIPEIEKTFKV
ncbi:MAG: hypothetical protein AMDU4_FER2C00300G0002, partial [Ferroplasma sp. Type II]